jgi:hypothetical protein
MPDSPNNNELPVWEQARLDSDLTLELPGVIGEKRSNLGGDAAPPYRPSTNGVGRCQGVELKEQSSCIF